MSLKIVSEKFTEATLDDIIRQAGAVSCLKFEFSDGFKKGDSYLSDLFRLKLYGKKENGENVEVSTVVKSIPKNIGRRKTFRSADFFRNECNFFNHILKQLTDFADSKDQSYQEIPKCFVAYTDGENDFVVLDDLGKYGYTTATRQAGLNFEHCLEFLKCLGKFHGLSLAFRDQKPEEFEQLTAYTEETYYAARLKPWYNDFIKVQQNVARDAVHREYPDTEYEAKLEQLFAGDLYDKMVQLTHTRTKYAVINHGDCWVPNFMLKYAKAGDASPISCRIIDFQLARYSSPALDISFFIYSCTKQDLRESCYDQLLQAYHQSAAATISALGSNPDNVFPFSALQSELKTFARFGVGMGIESIPFSLLKDEETADLDSIVGDEAVPITKLWILNNIQDQDGRLRLADMFKHATQCGYLD